MKLLYAFLLLLVTSHHAVAETIRGAMDCRITAQHRVSYSDDGILSSDTGRDGGDKIGAKLRLRYEIQRPMVGHNFDFKVEFGRFDILFDETYDKERIAALRSEDGKLFGVAGVAQDGRQTAYFTTNRIMLHARARMLSLSRQDDGNYRGLYQMAEGRDKPEKSHIISFDCHHKTDVIAQITKRLFADEEGQK